MHRGFGQVTLRDALVVNIPDDVHFVTVATERNRRLEGNKLAQMAHIDAIIIRITDLRRTTYDDNFLGVQTVEDADDALAQRSAAHNGIVDNYKIVLVGAQTAVGDVIYVRREVVARIVFGDESAEFDVLDGNFFAADITVANLRQLLPRRLAVKGENLVNLHLVVVLLQALQHSIIRHLGGIGNE